MKTNFFSIILIASMAMVVGCSDSDDAGPATGRMTVQLTDAPFPHDLVAEANVTIFKIEARNKEPRSDGAMEGDTTTGSDSSFTVLMEEEIEVNLLELTNGLTEKIVDAEVAVGTYDLIRVYVRGVNVVLTDGTTYDLTVPSGEQSGIKVFIKPGLTVVGNLSADLLLDFDVSRSFVPKGDGNDLEGITGFNFKPVIKASNLSTAGSIAGMVTTVEEDAVVGLEGAQVSIFAADTLNTTTFTDGTGSYMLMGLIAGNYEVTVELEGYGPLTAREVEISAANKITEDFQLVIEEAGN